jgi:hypothetical protein
MPGGTAQGCRRGHYTQTDKSSVFKDDAEVNKMYRKNVISISLSLSKRPREIFTNGRSHRRSTARNRYTLTFSPTPSASATGIHVHISGSTRTFSTHSTASRLPSKPSIASSSDGLVLETQRRRRVDRHDRNRIPSTQTNDATAAKNTTATTIIPNPSTRPSTKQSSVNSIFDGRGPCTNLFELSYRNRDSLWSNGSAVLFERHSCLRDQDFWSSTGDRGPMMLSKSSLQTVFERRSWLIGGLGIVR